MRGSSTGSHRSADPDLRRPHYPSNNTLITPDPPYRLFLLTPLTRLPASAPARNADRIPTFFSANDEFHRSFELAHPLAACPRPRGLDVPIEGRHRECGREVCECGEHGQVGWRSTVCARARGRRCFEEIEVEFGGVVMEACWLGPREGEEGGCAVGLWVGRWGRRVCVMVLL